MLVENIDKKVGPEFDGKTLLITGGTGSFGNAVLRRFLGSGLKEIRIFSRDEKKQDDMRQKLQNDKVKFYIGDVRDYESINQAMAGVDYVFHAAALKQVPSCEFYPMEAVRTNVMGTDNAIRAAYNNGVSRFVLLSTDKAVYPINTMGMTKAVAEKVVRAYARNVGDNGTVYNITRYGNVMASRGSVIPLFVDQIKAGRDITITDPGMTRFLMSLDEAVDLVLFAFLNGRQGETFIPTAPASTIKDLAEAIIEIFGAKGSKVRVIGTRHGEKKHETLINREELVHAERVDNFYRIFNDTRDLNYAKYVDTGNADVTELHDYTSNQELLDVEGVKKILLKLPYIQAQLEGENEHEKGLV
ncbi:MAG: SDR family NAD(P)-dependent oxidoreductase [Oscillospiraceae bacterium]|nr:SDR family NAD(P)-dependent oxidoreductase [Oscillospiraceae bacterium]